MEGEVQLSQVFNVTLKNKGVTYEVQLTQEEVNAIEKDQNRLDERFESLHAQHSTKHSESQLGHPEHYEHQQLQHESNIARPCTNENRVFQTLPHAHDLDHEFPTPTIFEEEEEETTKDNADSLFIWNNQAILLLISLYEERKENFDNPKMKKKILWRSISNILLSKGYNASWEECEKKWRSLKRSYIRIKDSKKRTGQGRKHWEYFDRFEDVFAPDADYNAPIIETLVEPLSQSSPTVLSVSVSSPIGVSSKFTDSSNTHVPSVLSLDDSQTQRSEDLQPLPKKSRRKKSKADEPPVWFIEYINRNEDRHEELINVLKERNSILEKLIDKL